MKSDGSDVEVRPEDQTKINEFGRNNARLHELRDDMAGLQKKLEELDDAMTELMMGSGDGVKLMIGGESFIDSSEEFGTEFCEAQQTKMAASLDEIKKEADSVAERQKELKKALYGRFGTAINLEES